MAQEYFEIANSPYLWAAAAVAVGLVLLQAILFTRKAWRSGKKMGMTEDQLKRGLRSGGISAVGPALAVLLGMVALISTMGGPISWMRLSFIGSIVFELAAARTGVSVMGAQLGGEGVTAVIWANAVWTMIIASVGWILMSALATPHLENVRTTLAGGNDDLVPIVGGAAMLGAFGYFIVDELAAVNNGSLSINNANSAAVIVGGIIMYILLRIADEYEMSWLREWSLGISMVAGLVAAVATKTLLGGA